LKFTSYKITFLGQFYEKIEHFLGKKSVENDSTVAKTAHFYNTFFFGDVGS